MKLYRAHMSQRRCTFEEMEFLKTRMHASCKFEPFTTFTHMGKDEEGKDKYEHVPEPGYWKAPYGAEALLSEAELVNWLPVELTGILDFQTLDLTDAKHPVARAADSYFNERCGVEQPTSRLMDVQEIRVALDYCTDAVNELLQEGYRILAICPQPDQRRPDYILGRSPKTIHESMKDSGEL